jgi:hypothetical protein
MVGTFYPNILSVVFKHNFFPFNYFVKQQKAIKELKYTPHNTDRRERAFVVCTSLKQ